MILQTVGILALVVFCFLADPVKAFAQPRQHPLDPLSQAEISTVVAVLKEAGQVDEVKAVASPTAREDTEGRAAAYGRFVAKNTVAVNHDHFLCYRLDLDVDGPQNSFALDELKAVQTSGESPRKSLWAVEPKVIRVEEAAKLQINMHEPALWRVINPGVLNPAGNPVSYQLLPGHDAMSLLDPTDYPRRRAGFTDYQLWVTPYRPDERYAAGRYPNQSAGGDGLPAWTQADRPIDNTDIVLWYTVGFHHVVRAEDWPTMPTSWHEFELRPFDFFAHNPALDLPNGQ